MSDRIDRCETCTWWERQGATLSSAARDPGAADDVGTCQAYPPDLQRVAFGAVGYFPVTHASRFCRDWQERVDDPDDGEREPVPDGTVVPFRSAA